MIELTIGIPCYNEAATIGKVVADFAAVFPGARVLIIDNASTDGTGRIAHAGGADVIVEPRQGKGYAVQRLFQETNSPYLLMVDGDDTYPAEEGRKLLAAMREQPADTVVGCRISPHGVAFKSAHRWANAFLSRLIYALFGFWCGDLFSGYRLFTRRFYRNVPLIASGFEIEAELVMQTIDKQFIQRNVDVQYRSRPPASHSKLKTLPDGTRVIWTLLMIVKDCKPLPFFCLLTLGFFALCLLAGYFPIRDYVAYHYVFRVPLAILAMGFGVLASLSLCCGLVLDTIVRLRKEEFLLRMRGQSYPPPPAADLSKTPAAAAEAKVLSGAI
jgi:glycosyltransferase involved in cell wall biosynthesis